MEWRNKKEKAKSSADTDLRFPLFVSPPLLYQCGIILTLDGILVIQADGSAQVYMNDYNHQFFELFTELRPLY